MKKVILAAIACIASLTFVKAQTTKGNLFIGTSIGSTSYNSAADNYNFTDGNYTKNNVKEYSIGVSPSIGVFLSDHFILGGNLAVNYTHEKIDENNTESAITTSSSTTNNSTFGIGPFIRYYFFNEKPSKTLFYLQADGSVATGSGSTTVTGTSANSGYVSNGNLSGIFTYNGGGSVGITRFIQKNIGLDVSVGYVYEHEAYTDSKTTNPTTGGASTTTSSNVTTHNNGINLAAGFHFFLP